MLEIGNRFQTDRLFDGWAFVKGVRRWVGGEFGVEGLEIRIGIGG